MLSLSLSITHTLSRTLHFTGELEFFSVFALLFQRKITGIRVYRLSGVIGSNRTELNRKKLFTNTNITEYTKYTYIFPRFKIS